MTGLTRENIDAEHYVARYARGALSEAEAERFEEFCLLHPELVREVQVDREMRRAMRAIDVRDRGGGRRIDWRPLALAAAVALVAILIGWQFWRSDSPGSALYAASTSLPAGLRGHVAGPFAVVRQRGAAVQTLRVPPGTQAIGLDLELPATGSPHYRIDLEESLGEAWVARGKLDLDIPHDAATVRVIIDLREAHGPRLRLVLSGPNGVPDAFELRLEEPR